MSAKSKIRLALFGAVGGAIGSASYGWMSDQTMARAILLAAAGALADILRPAAYPRCSGSQPVHKTINHALFARLVEGDGELVAVHGHHVAVAEFLVKHALADREG